MSHVDDGQLNAMLDKELDPEELRQVEGHLASCAQCRSRLDEARAFLIESGALLEMLDGQALRRSDAQKKPAVTAKERAIEIEPGIKKTQQEPAINIDGRTAKAAPSPFFPQAAERIAAQAGVELKAQQDAERARRRARWTDPTQLAWAATIVLAIGVGFLGNEVLDLRSRNGRAPMQEVASASTDSVQQAPNEEMQRPTERDRSGAGAASDRLGTRRQAAPDPAARQRAAAPATDAAKPPEGAGISQFSREPRPRQRPAEEIASAAAQGRADSGRPQVTSADERRAANALDRAPADVTGPAGGSRQPRAEAPSAPLSSSMRPPAPAAMREQPALGDVARTFQRISGDSAIRALSGSIRLVDGLQPRLIEIGRGNLVPGADPDRDVVRVHYTDPSGRTLTLDQQPGDSREGVSSVNGLMRGDTLITSAPEGLRVRWVDRKNFWLSLSGPLSPEELRSLVERIR